MDTFNINRVYLKLGNKMLSIIQGDIISSDEGTCEVAYITEGGKVSENPQGSVTASELAYMIETGSLNRRISLSEAWSEIKRMLYRFHDWN